MRDLVRELREAARHDTPTTCERLASALGFDCDECDDCDECVKNALWAMADRIEREYDPKPEPDTVEKVALEAVVRMTSCYAVGRAPEKQEVDGFYNRLKALGVTLDG